MNRIGRLGLSWADAPGANNAQQKRYERQSDGLHYISPSAIVIDGAQAAWMS